MAEHSGFFDAHLVDGKYDRVYLAEDFAKYIASLISNGIFGGKSSELIVRQKETADMSINVLPGRACINGYFYENTDELSLSIDVADGVLNRIDSVVLRWDNVERVIRLAVKKGDSATNPVAPSLQRDADYYELKLAEIDIKAGATSITQDRIIDTRLNTETCGFVIGAVQKFDTTEFGIQINGVIERLEKIAEENDIASLVFDVRTLENNKADKDEVKDVQEYAESTAVLSSYLALVGNVNVDLTNAALGMNNEDKILGVGKALAMYAKFKDPNLATPSEALPAVYTYDRLADFSTDAVQEVLDNSQLRALLESNKYMYEKLIVDKATNYIYDTYNSKIFSIGSDLATPVKLVSILSGATNISISIQSSDPFKAYFNKKNSNATVILYKFDIVLPTNGGKYFNFMVTNVGNSYASCTKIGVLNLDGTEFDRSIDNPVTGGYSIDVTGLTEIQIGFVVKFSSVNDPFTPLTLNRVLFSDFKLY